MRSSGSPSAQKNGERSTTASKSKRPQRRRVSSPPERYLLARAKSKTLDEAIETLVDQLLGPAYSLPVQPALIAQRRGVSFGFSSDIDALGETRRMQHGHEIALRSDGTRRQRFTFAHELAHVMLDERKRPFAKTANLEQLCDQIAAALLMPRQDLLARIRRCTIAELLQVQDDFDVSLHSAALRFTRLTGCGVFRAHIFKERQIEVTRLGGPLRETDPAVRSTIEGSMPAWDPTIAVVAQGRKRQLWSVEFAKLPGGEILCLFRRQQDVRLR